MYWYMAIFCCQLSKMELYLFSSQHNNIIIPSSSSTTNISNTYRTQCRPCERGFEVQLQAYPVNTDFNSRPCERGFSKKHQFSYLSFAVFYSLNTFSQNKFFQIPDLISIGLIFVHFSLRRSPGILCMGNICARFYNNKGSPASTFNFFPIESILFW